MQKFFGGVLMAVGLLVAGLSGICCLGVLVSAFFDPAALVRAGGAQLLSSLFIVLLTGGIPLAAGIGSFIAGRRMVRNADGPPPPPPPEPAGPRTEARIVDTQEPPE